MNYLPAPKTLLPFSKQHFRRGVAPSESVGKTWCLQFARSCVRADCTRRWLTIRGRQTLHGPLLLVHFRQNRNAARCSGSPGGARIWASSLVTSLSGRWMTTLNSAEHRQSGLDFLVCDQKSTCSGTAPYAGIYQGFPSRLLAAPGSPLVEALPECSFPISFQSHLAEYLSSRTTPDAFDGNGRKWRPATASAARRIILRAAAWRPSDAAARSIFSLWPMSSPSQRSSSP